MKIIENIKFIQDGTLVFGDIYFENGFIERIDYKTPHMESDIAIPGFVALHTYGCGDYSCNDCNPEHLKALAQEYPKRGITSFCATLPAASLRTYEKIILAYEQVFGGEYKGGRFEGFHLEGPYLNPDMCNDKIKEKLQEIHMGELECFLSKYHDSIKVMTIAPELKQAQEAIQLMHLYGVDVSLGYTNASYQEVNEAFALGASQITHLGNAMPRLNKKYPTIIDAVFLSECKCEIIMDGIHMHPQMLQWVIRLLGSERIIAVGAETKDFSLLYPTDKNECDMSIERGKDLLDIFQYLYKQQHYPIQDCIRVCSTNAAKILKSYTSEIGLGKCVDLVVLDQDLHIKDVIVNGKRVL